MTVLYEGKGFAVIQKEPGVSSEPDGSGRDVITSASLQFGHECFPVHRLDRETGGAMIVATSKKTAAALCAAVSEHRIKKEYLAVVGGIPTPAEGNYTDLLFRDARKNKSFVVDRARKGVKEASLDYTVLGTVDGCSLVRVLLHTGRTHQIRVQFAHRRMPLLGDSRYGSRVKCPLALWSNSLTFTAPDTGEDITVTSAPPDDSPWNLF